MASTSNIIQYIKKRKSLGIAYALWFFIGIFGAHRMYALTNDKEFDAIACAMPFCAIGGPLLMIFFSGNAAMWALGLIALVFAAAVNLCDLFMIPSIIKRSNLKIIEGMGLDVKDIDIRV